MADWEINKGVSVEFQGDLIRCSNCKAIFWYPYDNDCAEVMNPMDWKYCPMCGEKIEDDNDD